MQLRLGFLICRLQPQHLLEVFNCFCRPSHCCPVAAEAASVVRAIMLADLMQTVEATQHHSSLSLDIWQVSVHIRTCVLLLSEVFKALAFVISASRICKMGLLVEQSCYSGAMRDIQQYLAEPLRRKAFTLYGSRRSTYPQSASASARLFSFKWASARLLYALARALSSSRASLYSFTAYRRAHDMHSHATMLMWSETAAGYKHV